MRLPNTGGFVCIGTQSTKFVELESTMSPCPESPVTEMLNPFVPLNPAPVLANCGVERTTSRLAAGVVIFPNALLTIHR